jgi:hypothetical protein
MLQTLRIALVGLAISAFASGATALGDIKVTYQLKDKGLFGSSGGGTEVVLHSKFYTRTINELEGKDTLLDYQNLVKYKIDHKNKVVEKSSLADEYKADCLLLDEMTKALKDNRNGRAKRVIKFLEEEEGDLSVERLGTEMVAGRKCEKWKIALGKNFVGEVSVDPSLVHPAPSNALEEVDRLESYAVLTNPLMGKTYAKFCNELLRIRGIHLKSEVSMPLWIFSVGESKEATEVVLGPIPPSMFELPKGYTIQDVGKARLERLTQKK